MQSALTFSPFHVPRTRYFSIPLSSPIFPFCRRFNTGGLTEHSRFRSQALMWAFMIVAACLSHILFFLEDKTPCSCRPAAGCKRHSLQNRRYRFFFFCVLQASTKTSPKHDASAELELQRVRGGGGGALPSNRLMGMCRWMGSHFHDWMDYNGVAFSTELLEWGRIFSGFWGKNILASSKFGY